MSDDPYLYPGTDVLRNKLGLEDASQLDFHERELVLQRIRQGAPKGNFDLAHLQAIHRHLFQDIYPWAGQVRTVEMWKGESQFQFRQYVATGMADVNRRIVGGRHFQGLGRKDFAARLGEVIGDVNFVHPFREGNGRTQLQFARQLAEKAGHRLDLTRLVAPEWIRASQEAMNASYGPMAQCFEKALTGRVKVQSPLQSTRDRDDERER